MKTALIIGITGQDGAYLARYLLGLGYRVCGTSRTGAGTACRSAPNANLQALGVREQVELFALDLEELAAPAGPAVLADLLDRVAPDEIYHLAGQSSVGISFQQPLATFNGIAAGTAALLETLRRQGSPARLCLAASGDCFADTGGRPFTEETPLKPRSPYAVAKAAAYWQTAVYREAYGMFAASALLFNHESPLRPLHFVTRKIIRTVMEIAAGRADRLDLGNLEIVRDWGWAEEYVTALHLMLQADQPDDFIVATGHSHSLKDFVARAFALKNLDWRDYTHSDPGLLRPSETPIHRADPSRIADRLGWRAQKTMPEVVAAMLEAEEDRELSPGGS